MDIRAGLVESDASDGVFWHDAGEGVPRADVEPCAAVAPDGDVLFLLGDCIVKADFRQFFIAVVEVFVAVKGEDFLHLAEYIAEPECKDAAVPQCAFADIFLCGRLVRFFPEGGDFALCVTRLGEDVAVFFAGIGWFDAHEEERRSALSFDLGEEVCDGAEIVGGNVGVGGANGDGFCEWYAAYLVQIGADKGDGGEGVAAARLD